MCDMVYGVVWYGFYGMVWYCVYNTWYDLVWYGMVCDIWYDSDLMSFSVWCGMIKIVYLINIISYLYTNLYY